MAKARRGGKRQLVRRTDGLHGPPAREHWRADGSPKTAYASQDDANRFSFQLRLEQGLELDPYVCRTCGSWHLGNPRRD